VMLPDGRLLERGAEVVTFVARNLEPIRGFPSFMRSLPALLTRRPAAEVVVVGGDGISYGPPLPSGETHRQRLVAELGSALDTSRVHFLGNLSYEKYLDVLALSSAHVYLTYPFVLSWSMLEAMACECLVIASATAPVTEVVEHGRNGLLVDFFDTAQLAATVTEALESPERMTPIRRRARETIMERYDLTTIGLPGYLRLIEELIRQ
jgi:glycosyltransferase involved in cell wall biosynthesis